MYRVERRTILTLKDLMRRMRLRGGVLCTTVLIHQSNQNGHQQQQKKSMVT